MEKSNKTYIIEPIKEQLTYEECLKALLDKCLKDKEELKSQEYTVLKDKDTFMIIQSLSPFQVSISSKSICNGKEVPFYKEYEFKEFSDVTDFLATQKQYYADKENEFKALLKKAKEMGIMWPFFDLHVTIIVTFVIKFITFEFLKSFSHEIVNFEASP